MKLYLQSVTTASKKLFATCKMNSCNCSFLSVHVVFPTSRKFPPSAHFSILGSARAWLMWFIKAKQDGKWIPICTPKSFHNTRVWGIGLATGARNCFRRFVLSSLKYSYPVVSVISRHFAALWRNLLHGADKRGPSVQPYHPVRWGSVTAC